MSQSSTTTTGAATGQVTPVGVPRLSFPLVAGLVLSIAAFLRFYDIGQESFWFDEAVTTRYTVKGPAVAWQANANDTTPPLYFVGLAIWRTIFGHTDVVLRSYGALWSLIGIAVIGAFTKSIRGYLPAVAAMALTAVNPLDIYYAQEARPYSQTAALTVLSSYILWMWLIKREENASRNRHILFGLLYSVAAAALVLTHYLAAVIPVSHFIVLLLRRRKADMFAYIGSAILTGILLIPWVVQLTQNAGGFSLKNIGWMSKPAISDYFIFVVREFFWGATPATSTQLAITSGIVLLAVIVSARHQVRRTSFDLGPAAAGFTAQIYLLLLIVVPVIITMAAPLILRHHVFYPQRFSTLVLAPFIILCAVSLRQRPGLLCLLMVWTAMAYGYLHQERMNHKTDWRSFARMWKKQGPPEAAAFFPHYNVVSANHYLRPPIKPLLLEHMPTALSALNGRTTWLVMQSGFSLELQFGEKLMSARMHELGCAITLPSPFDLDIRSITVNQWVPTAWQHIVDWWSEPRDIGTRTSGFEDPVHFGPVMFDTEGKLCRTSAQSASFQLTGVDDATTCVIRARVPAPLRDSELQFYITRVHQTTAPLSQQPVARFHQMSSEPFPFALPLPEGSGPLSIAWKFQQSKPAEPGSMSHKGLDIYWIGTRKPDNPGS